MILMRTSFHGFTLLEIPARSSAVDNDPEQRYVWLNEIFVEVSFPGLGASMPVWRFAAIPG